MDIKLRKRRETEPQPNPQAEQIGKDIQNVLKGMYDCIVEGGKKIIQKVAEMIDPQAQPQNPEAQSNQF